jgi:hypothetical protein
MKNIISPSPQLKLQIHKSSLLINRKLKVKKMKENVKIK